LTEVNYPRLSPQSQLAIFALLGLTLVFIRYPIHPRFAQKLYSELLDLLLVLATVVCFGYVLVQSEPIFQRFWLDGQPLGNRAGLEQPLDYMMGLFGILLVLEATRRAIGLTLPLLSLVFLLYAVYGPAMPDWLFPHRGYPGERIVSQTFLHSQGVFGIALKVMFTYVFLFVLFGTVLEQTGATGFIIDFAKRLFRASAGGAAKVSVISSGMMGSLSGSAVANTATTGTFTIPMMKSSGFKPTTAAGVEAAASSGGALMPPIMGAGAYMMLEIIEPPVTYLQIIKAALIPAILYYATLLLIVHFRAKLVGASTEVAIEQQDETSEKYKGFLFFSAFVTLIFFLIIGYTPF
ncbi:TRAP transporter large permease subunit, partial [candidate division KSB1 bacterium]|nr:TRAP transporter large permease subunit [candidate division KSB1 bacterium]NIR73304.1 TRAP transporter large permease subunit [candidate division KSB1 bacterium]NIS27010.1 TRAP transporter large permease subunit [candidate division KSB1 bacterium]NIT73850.1 TRAP transporter large permease subunit [candidate division KSB1 bacterium]NIU27755.1 TRAP transporter large permease subunit [candidate division KSB1 bacterium]